MCECMCVREREGERESMDVYEYLLRHLVRVEIK